MNSSDTIVIIPTYNEAENIAEIIKEIRNLGLHILVVDDNSPDSTSSIVKNIMETNKNVNLLERSSKKGLGSAYRDGFQYCIEKDYKYLVQMDADFSHRLEDLSKMKKEQAKRDLIIGSRYIEGGSSVGWNNLRKNLSKFANIYAKTITRSKINDMTSGFRIYSAKALEKIDYQDTKSDGYGFQIEMTVRALRKNLEIKEVPIIFNERREGQSKMTLKIIIEAIFLVLRLR